MTKTNIAMSSEVCPDIKTSLLLKRSPSTPLSRINGQAASAWNPMNAAPVTSLYPFQTNMGTQCKCTPPMMM